MPNLWLILCYAGWWAVADVVTLLGVNCQTMGRRCSRAGRAQAGYLGKAVVGKLKPACWTQGKQHRLVASRLAGSGFLLTERVGVKGWQAWMRVMDWPRRFVWRTSTHLYAEYRVFTHSVL